MENPPISPDTPRFSTESFFSHERAVAVDIFDLPNGPCPTVVLLHGSDGLELRREAFESFAAFLARRGVAVFLVHYFDGTGVQIVNRAIMLEKFTTWANTISDAVDFAGSRQGVAPSKVGLLGFSLGASLALSVAAAKPGIGAVVQYFGGMPPVTEAVLQSMPPTVIIHGAADLIVPVEEAYRLERLLKERSSVYEMRIFPDEGHFFGE